MKRNYDYLNHPVKKTESYPVGERDGSHLSDLEREWLARIPSEGWELSGRTPVDYMHDTRTPGEKAAEWTPSRLRDESAVIVYRGEFGLSMGAVRGRTPAGRNGYTMDTFEASPFPGAWELVTIDRILLVAHPETI